MQRQADAFPFRMFILYILFYSGQAIYSYINLYFNQSGVSTSQIGLIVSVSTAFALAAQMFWGVASDRAKYKNTILLILYAACAIVLLLFYTGTAYWQLLTLYTLFACVFNPIMALQDNLMLETLEKSRWDYGQIRLGGTVGYSLTVLLIGFVLQDRYANIFWMSASMMAICFFLSLGLPKVEGHRNKAQKTPYRVLLKNTALLGIIAFNLCYSLGSNMYYSFYPIYFASIGGDSSLIGIMMFVSAAAEIPVLFFINRIVKRIGTGRMLLISGVATAIRWYLLYFLTNPSMIIAANLLHGVGFTGFSYCIVTYINASVPKDLRATSQSLNVLIGSVFSRVLFGYLGGLASETFGTQNIMLVSGIIMTIGTALFFLWMKLRKESLEPVALGE